jgi:alpha-glucosidase (family GH31 glycosyl hydrolase)
VNPANVYLSTTGGTLIMMDKYMQLDLNLPSRRIYGLGERNGDFLRGEGSWTMWANGQETPFDYGTSGASQGYGVHPFALVQTSKPGEFMGVFFRNSNAMSPVITYTGEKESTLSFITTGGQIEIYFFFKGGPKDIIKAYQNFIGKPTLTPFWSLGWHASAYAYKTQDDVQANINGYKDAKIPLEGIWLDIPYLDGYADFSVNKTAFPDIKGLTDTCHQNNQRVIPIIDAGISADDLNNKYILQANQDGLLVMSGNHSEGQNDFIINHVWPNKTAFLDFFNPKSKDVWGTGFKDLYALFQYDGIWLDMNEATGFCNGECPDGIVPDGQPKPSPDSNNGWWTSYDSQDEISTYKLPFIPGGVYNLDNMTLSLNATHPYNNLTEYDVHSLFGHVEGMRTHEIFVDDTSSPLADKRTFLLSRSTFAGSGQYV